jgi:hypothetical protein
MTTKIDSIATAEKNKSTQEIAHVNENNILYWLNRFGYMTAPQVAAVIYRHRTQSERLARRSLARLVEHGYVICNKGYVGAFNHFAISRKGAKRLWDIYDIQAVSGKNLIRIPSAHRDAANWAAIRLMYEGWKVYTDREIQTGKAPFKKMSEKIPDVIGYDEDGMTLWGEVEASPKGGRDVTKLADWLITHAFMPSGEFYVALNPPQETLFLHRVRFILVSPLIRTFPKKLRTALDKRLLSLGMDAGYFTTNRVEFQFGLELDALLRNGYDDWRIDGLLEQTPFSY